MRTLFDDDDGDRKKRRGRKALPVTGRGGL
jgi:hypothetical protein